MWLTKVAINRRVTIAMVILALLVMGYVGLSRMPWDINPNVDIPYISVTVPYPGAGPSEIEQRVLRPLEDAVSIISGVKNVTSTARENLAASESAIRDTDFGKEMAEFSTASILVQSATAFLAQANNLPQNILSLIR